MRASGVFVQVLVEERKANFVSTETVMREGEVISVGEEAKNVKKGDTVLFSRETHVIEHSIKGKTHFFVDYKNIVAKE